MAGRDPLMVGGFCDCAREWASLRLDDEISPLEDELLERHLEACEDCRAFEEDVRWATDVLRLAPVERPARRVTIPARRAARFTLERRRTAVVAAAALALGALVGSLLEGPGQPAPSSPPPQVSLLSNDANQLQLDLPRTRILTPPPVPATPPNPPEGVI